MYIYTHRIGRYTPIIWGQKDPFHPSQQVPSCQTLSPCCRPKLRSPSQTSGFRSAVCFGVLGLLLGVELGEYGERTLW